MTPIVSFSTNTTKLVESEASVLTFNFTVDGDIPEGGLPISLKVDANLDDGNQWFFDFDAGRPSINEPNEGDVTLTPFARNAEGIGGRVFRDITILPSVEPPNDVINLVITGNEASFDLPIFDDGFAERGETVVFTLQDGEGYTIDAATTPAAINLLDGPDGVIDATNPVVSLSVDQTTVTEGELFTVNFNVEGDIPEGGLEVYVDGDLPGGLSEFGVDGVVPVGAGFPGPDGDAGGFVVTLTENQASLTLPVFKDGLGEGVENLSFTLLDGELYEANTASNQVTLTIEEAAPTISIDTLGGIFDGSTLITPNLVESPDEGVAVMSIALTSDAPVPEEGLIVNVNSSLADITQFVEQAGPAPEVFGGEVVGAIYNDQGMATGFQVRMDQPNAVINLLRVSLEAEGAQDVTFMVETGEGYELSSEMGSSTITVYDTIDQVPAPTSTPEVGLSISTDELREGRGAATLNFTVNGEIPEEGVVVYVNSGVRAGLGEFDIFNAGVSGGAFPAPDGNAGGFYFKITEPTASITLQAVDDDIDEGLESFTFMLEEAPGYTIAADMASDSLIIADGRNSEIQVSLTGEPEVLVEAEGTVSTHTISLSAPPPEEGLSVRVSAPNVGEFDLNMVQLTGATVTGTGTDDAGLYLDLNITAQEVMIELPVANDGVAEGLETAVFNLVPGEGYEINPEASGNSFTIVDTADEKPAAPITEGRYDSIGDTIATAKESGLSANSNSVTIEANINGNFFDSDLTQRTDNTEDVDMYSVELQAGDVLRLDIDARNTRSSDESPDTILRLFDADGNQLAQSDDNFAPDELFGPGRQDSYLEFTPDMAGTYYVGVSSFGNGEFGFTNNPYDPNVRGSGTGRSDGAYTLNMSLNATPGSTETEIPASTGDGPTVSLSATPATYNSDDNLIANALVQYTPERREASILTLGLEVDGMIPEEGVEVYLTSDINLSTVFSTRAPFSSEGVEVLGAVFNDAGEPVGLKLNLTANSGFINLNLDDPDEAPTDGEQTVSFMLEPAAGYTVGDGSFSTVIYDTLANVPELPTVPTVGISISETALVESEGNTTTLTFTLDSPPPADGLTINVESGIRAALGEFDVFNAEIEGGNFPSPNFQASGFFFTMTEQTATITLAAFDETTNPEIPAEDALEGIDEFTFTVQPGVGYEVSDNNSVTVTIADNSDSVVLPPDDGGTGGDDTSLPEETEFNDTIADAIVVDISPTNPVYEVAGEIGTTRDTRNLIDRSEDVDMYAFTLEAGQTIILDVDAGGVGGVEGSLLDSVLRVFDADGNELANVGNAPAPDEVFQSNGDPYIEFTAPEAGTYYAGISNLGNTFYDPNEQGSGSGWTFDGRFEPGEYVLKATLDVPPVVSFEVTPENFSEEDADTDNLVEWKWTVTGKFPAEGITVNLTTSGGGAPFAFTEQFAASPDAEFVDADIVGFDNETGDLNILLTSPEASFKLYFGNDIIEEGAQPFEFFLVDGDGYTVDQENNGTIFTITDDNGGIGVGPTVGLTVSETNLAEGDAFTVNFNVTGDIPPEGVQVLVQSDMFGALGQFDLADLSNLTLSGIAGVPEVGDNGGGSFLVTITEPQASIGLSVFDDIVAEELNTINFTLANGELYQVDPSAETVTLNISDEEIPGAKPTVSISVDKTDLVEGETVTLSFAIDGEIPAEGLTVLVNDVNSAQNQLRSLTEFDVSAIELSSGISFPEPAEGDSGFFVTITEATASITLPVFDDGADEDEAEEVFTFEVIDGEAYEVSADASSVTINITDVADTPPVVSFSTTPGLISEAEGTALVMNFSVTGNIPPEGITVNLEGDAARIMQQFTAAQTRFNDDGETFNRFDKGLVNNNVVGGTLELFSLEDGDPSESASNPEAAGDAYLTNFSFTITEANATITIPVFDDLIEEADATYTYTLVDGNGYTVDESANSSTFTVTDGVVGGEGPTVGVSATPTTLIESEQTAVTLTFTAEGDIPPEGVVVVLEGPPRAIAEFDVNATNPRLPESETVVEGPVVTGGNIVGTNEVVGALFFRITDPTATVTVPVFQDEIEEGTENLTFNLKDGELYNVDENASAVSVKIEDVTPPVVSFSTTPTTINEAEGTALVMNFSVEGDIPEGGITVNLEGDAARIMQQFTAAQTRFNDAGETFNRFDKGLVRDNVVGGTLELFSLEDGDPSESASNPEAAGDAYLTNFSFTITEPTASITLPVFNDIIEEADATYTYNLVDGNGYSINPEANSGTFTVTDGVVGGEGPRVEILATPGTLYEKDATEITLNLRTRGDIPEGGVVVFIEGPPRAIAEFDINATNPRLPEDETVVEGPVVTGGSIVGTNEVVGGFFFRITESSSSITVPVFQDDVEEGSETFTFILRDGEEYQVREGRDSVTVTIDDVLEPPVVSMTGSPTLLRESDSTVLELNFSATGTVPESGTTVVLEITDPGLSGIQLSRPSNEGDNVGISIPSRSRQTITDEDGNFVKLLQRVTITEANATLRLPVVDDIFLEEDMEYTINLVEGEGYDIDAAATNSATFTVSDGDLPTDLPLISLRSTPGTLYESEQSVVSLSLSASRRGPFPEEGGVVVYIDSDVSAALGEFAINGSARTGEVEGEALVVSGGEIIGTDNDGSGFFFRMDERSASIQVPVFADDVEEGPETFTFTLAPGEAYEAREGRDSVTVTIEDTVEPPVVTMTGSPTLLKESDGTSLELNFTATGTIPESGTTVVLELYDPALSGIQLSRPSNEGDNVGIEIPGGSRQTITDEDGNFVKLLQRVTITEANATLRLPVVDDIFLEEDMEYTINLVDSEGYNIDAAASNSVTFTVSDGDLPTPVTVGVTATPEMLYESEQSVVNLSFNVEGDIPAEGVEVFLDSDVSAALGEFDINGSARTGEVEGEALVVSGGEIIGTDNDGSGFFFRIDEANATIQVPVFPDEEVEGAETFTFTLSEGEAYNVDANASAVSVTIDDVAPEVSFSVNTTALSEEEATLFTFSFSVDGVIPEGGLEVALGGELLPFVNQLDFSNFDFSNPDNVQGVEIGSFGEDGSISLTLLEPSASLSVRVFDDVVKEADANFDLMLLDGDGYSVNQEANGATITVTDGVIVDNPPVVSLSLSDSSVSEGEEFTVNFSVDGDVSEDNPLTVLVQSTSEGALGEFNIFNEDNTPAFTTTGISGVPTVGDDTGSSFLVELTDTEASINLSVFNDGIGEGTETFNFALVDGERYNSDATNNQVALTIEETPAEVKFEADSNGEVSKFAYDLTGAGNAEVTATVDQEALDITDAAFDNYVGFYEVVDSNGGIDTDGDGVADFNPGDTGYAQAALENAVDGLALRLGGNPNDDTSAGSFGDSVLQGGTFYAPFAIANAGDMTVADFLAANPDNNAATEVDDQVAYFAFGEANPDGANHLKSWGDGIFGFEDLPSNIAGVSDNDFDDAVFKFNFTA